MDASIVELVDVVESRPLHVFDVAPGSFAMDQLALVEAVERLGHGVVAGITTRSNRGNGADVTQSFGVANAEILTPRSL